DPCQNLKAGAAILEECYHRANKKSDTNNHPNQNLQAAFSCYYSGNFQRGFIPDIKGQPSYVQKVLAKLESPGLSIPIVNTPKSPQEIRQKSTIVFEDGPNTENENLPPKTQALVF